jgi:hypothetical protein
MNGRPEGDDDTARLISGLLDGQLLEKDRLRLELQLETDPVACRLYLQMIEQEVELSCLAGPADTGKVVSLAAAQNEKRVHWLLVAAAAAVVVLAALWMVPPRDTGRRQPIAVGDAASWEADFENGAAPGWTGEIVATGLPPGSRHGLKTVGEPSANGPVYQIALPADWNDGLFALTPRSTLHLTYRLGQPTGMDVLLHTLPADPVAGRPSMFRLTAARFPGTAGVWQTASIPFALFQRKVPDPATGELVFRGGPPSVGEAVAALSFSQPHEFELVIDRIWITLDGTGVETIRPFP